MRVSQYEEPRFSAVAASLERAINGDKFWLFGVIALKGLEILNLLAAILHVTIMALGVPVVSVFFDHAIYPDDVVDNPTDHAFDQLGLVGDNHGDCLFILFIHPLRSRYDREVRVRGDSVANLVWVNKVGRAEVRVRGCLSNEVTDVLACLKDIAALFTRLTPVLSGVLDTFRLVRRGGQVLTVGDGRPKSSWISCQQAFRMAFEVWLQ